MLLIDHLMAIIILSFKNYILTDLEHGFKPFKNTKKMFQVFYYTVLVISPFFCNPIIRIGVVHKIFYFVILNFNGFSGGSVSK